MKNDRRSARLNYLADKRRAARPAEVGCSHNNLVTTRKGTTSSFSSPCDTSKSGGQTEALQKHATGRPKHETDVSQPQDVGSSVGARTYLKK